MKILLTQFRISNWLDHRRPVRESTRAAIADSVELRQFARRAEELDRVLRAPLRFAETDPSLRQSIMRAVRAAAVRQRPERNNSWHWLATASAASAVVALAIWIAAPRPQKIVKPPSGESALAMVSAALEMGGKMPTEMVAPLSNEWAQVDYDVRGATRFVLANLP